MEVAQATFDLTPEQMRREIVAAVTEVADVLARKGVPYAELRNALTPQTERRDVALLFDSTQTGSNWYGLDIARAYLPLLPREASLSVLEGDLLGRHGQESRLRNLVDAHLLASGNQYTWHYSNHFFCVFIHNLSDAQLATLVAGLKSYQPFVGHLDMTFGSRIRNYLSAILVPRFIKHRDVVVLGHEDEFSDDPDVNILGYPFEEIGLRVKSLRPTYYGVCLSYKVERNGIPSDATDVRMSLNAISASPDDLTSMTVEIADPKFQYLKAAKRHAIEGLGVTTSQGLADVIQEKIGAGYIYSLSYLAEHGVSKFNMLLELEKSDTGEPFRVVAAFEYLPSDRALRLITLY